MGLSYSILHRYFFIRNAMYEKGLRTDDWDSVNYNNFYLRNECSKECPENSHCEWSYCECYPGSIKFRGKCHDSIKVEMMENVTNIDRTGEKCYSNEACSKHDINLVCGPDNQCRCRKQMKYNPRAQECQILMDINCGNYTYDSRVSMIVKEAAQKANNAIVGSSIRADRA